MITVILPLSAFINSISDNERISLIVFKSYGHTLHSMEWWRFKMEVTLLRTVSASPGGSFQIPYSTDARNWCLLIRLGVITKSRPSSRKES